MQSVLKTTDLTKSFGTRKAVNKVSFDLPEGSFLSIFGPNGAGKTTLLRMLTTLTRPTSGTIEVLGLDAKEKTELIRNNIGFISHNSMLYPDLTAEENLALVAGLYGVENPGDRVTEMLEAVELAHRRFDPVKTFSRGMVQRLSIARALIHDPGVIFLDEPYSGLDPRATHVFDNLIAEIRKGRTLVMVSHDLEKGFSLCTHAYVMNKGKTCFFGEKSTFEKDSFLKSYEEALGGGLI